MTLNIDSTLKEFEQSLLALPTHKKGEEEENWRVQTAARNLKLSTACLYGNQWKTLCSAKNRYVTIQKSGGFDRYIFTSSTKTETESALIHLFNVQLQFLIRDGKWTEAKNLIEEFSHPTILQTVLQSLVQKDPLSAEQKEFLQFLCSKNPKNEILAAAAKVWSREAVQYFATNYHSYSWDTIRRVDLIIQKTLSYPATKRLYDEACSGGIWKVKFVPRKEMRFGASCTGATRTISIAEDNHPNKDFSLYVFELTNATQQTKFQSLVSKAFSNIITSDEYAKETVRIEFAGSKRHHTIMQQAGLTNDDHFNKIQFEKGFDFYWDHHEFVDSQTKKKVIGYKNLTHAQNYRNQYKSIRKFALAY